MFKEIEPSLEQIQLAGAHVLRCNLDDDAGGPISDSNWTPWTPNSRPPQNKPYNFAESAPNSRSLAAQRLGIPSGAKGQQEANKGPEASPRLNGLTHNRIQSVCCPPKNGLRKTTPKSGNLGALEVESPIRSGVSRNSRSQLSPRLRAS